MRTLFYDWATLRVKESSHNQQRIVGLLAKNKLAFSETRFNLRTGPGRATRYIKFSTRVPENVLCPLMHQWHETLWKGGQWGFRGRDSALPQSGQSTSTLLNGTTKSVAQRSDLGRIFLKGKPSRSFLSLPSREILLGSKRQATNIVLHLYYRSFWSVSSFQQLLY